jgi:hypothetical protein
MVSAALAATHRCGKYISAAVNQHTTIEDAVFSVGAAPRLYKEDLRLLELELRSRIGSCSRELRESPELAVGRIIEKKWQERN